VTLQILHDAKTQEFFANIEGLRAVLQYRMANGLMTIVHTGVPPALKNRGIAAELTRTALEYARARGWKVEPACSYARAYMQKHGAYADLAAGGAAAPAPGPEFPAAAEQERQHMDSLLDEALDESFPASDVPAVGGTD
jgi:predicted GNAT family acetyltransferase